MSIGSVTVTSPDSGSSILQGTATLQVTATVSLVGGYSIAYWYVTLDGVTIYTGGTGNSFNQVVSLPALSAGSHSLGVVAFTGDIAVTRSVPITVSTLYTQFNGLNIIPMPSSPGPRQIDFTQHDTVGVSRSPFTGAGTQRQVWAGADWWELNVSLPLLSLEQSAEWEAWFAALRGITNVFQIGNRQKRIPRGTPQGTPVVNGNQLAMKTMLNTRGWRASQFRLLLPGDHIQIGYRLHTVAGVSPVNSDSSGNATIEIWPSLREPLTDGAAIITHDAKGLFMLPDNAREYSMKYDNLGTFSFKAIEAR